MIYILIFFFLFIPVIKYDILAMRGGERVWYWSSLIILIAVAALRYRVGGDTLVYMAEYNMYPKLDELRYFDFETASFNPLWYILNAFCRSVSDSYIFFQLIHALIVNCSFFHFFKKYCPNYYFSAILVWFVGYWCYFSMEILREILCICMLLWAVDWLLEKKLVKYYIVCIVALFMHYSSVVMLFFPLMYVVFKRPNWMLQLIILMVVICFTKVIDIASLIMGVFALNDQLEILIENYLEVATKNLTGALFELFIYLPVLGIIWLRQRNRLEDEYDFVPIISCMVIFTGLSTYLGIASRFLNYFAPFFVVVFVNTIYKMFNMVEGWKNRHVSAVITVSVLFVVSFEYIYYYTKDQSDIYPDTRRYSIFVPYHTVFNPIVEEKRESYVENLRDFALFF